MSSGMSVCALTAPAHARSRQQDTLRTGWLAAKGAMPAPAFTLKRHSGKPREDWLPGQCRRSGSDIEILQARRRRIVFAGQTHLHPRPLGYAQSMDTSSVAEGMRERKCVAAASASAMLSAPCRPSGACSPERPERAPPPLDEDSMSSLPASAGFFISSKGPLTKSVQVGGWSSRRCAGPEAQPRPVGGASQLPSCA